VAAMLCASEIIDAYVQLDSALLHGLPLRELSDKQWREWSPTLARGLPPLGRADRPGRRGSGDRVQHDMRRDGHPALSAGPVCLGACVRPLPRGSHGWS
jgi:hypothetical protein